MSEEIQGIIGVFRPAFARQINETLFFTLDRTVVARTSSGKGGMLFGAIGGGIEAHRKMRKKL